MADIQGGEQMRKLIHGYLPNSAKQSSGATMRFYTMHNQDVLYCHVDAVNIDSSIWPSWALLYTEDEFSLHAAVNSLYKPSKSPAASSSSMSPSWISLASSRSRSLASCAFFNSRRCWFMG